MILAKGKLESTWDNISTTAADMIAYRQKFLKIPQDAIFLYQRFWDYVWALNNTRLFVTYDTITCRAAFLTE